MRYNQPITNNNICQKAIHISRLKICQIKCFDEIEINLNSSHNTTLITGVNARGKSTLLQLIALGLNGIKTVHFPYSWKQVVKTNAHFGTFEMDIVFDGQLRNVHEIISLFTIFYSCFGNERSDFPKLKLKFREIRFAPFPKQQNGKLFHVYS